MQKLIFTNSRGASVSFDTVTPYLFWKLEGIGLPPVTPIQTQTVGQNGYTLHSTLLESREVRLTGHIYSRESLKAFYSARKRINAVCNPLLGPGWILYENNYGVFKTGAFVTDIAYKDRVGSSQTLTVSFECPSPFWTAAEKSVALLAYMWGGMSFPIKTPNRFGVLGYQAIIDNDSDADTPIELTMDGGSLNPEIINQTTGEFIKLAHQVNPGDKLYINTDPEYLEVSLITTDPESNQKVKQNAYGYITHDSSLFKLVPGVNRLTFESDDENTAVRLVIGFYKRYVGV